MKKLISAALCIAMVLSLTACGSKIIGSIKGAEYEKIMIDDIEYIRIFDSGWPALFSRNRVGATC